MVWRNLNCWSLLLSFIANCFRAWSGCVTKNLLELFCGMFPIWPLYFFAYRRFVFRKCSSSSSWRSHPCTASHYVDQNMTEKRSNGMKKKNECLWRIITLKSFQNKTTQNMIILEWSRNEPWDADMKKLKKILRMPMVKKFAKCYANVQEWVVKSLPLLWYVVNANHTISNKAELFF